MDKRFDKRECEHKYTFKKEELYQNANTVFSKKICEKCGKEIVMSRKSKMLIILFTIVMVTLIVLIPGTLKSIIPGVSYFAKGLVAVFIFCVIYGAGFYWLMNRATYDTYVPSDRFRNAYEQARKENDERTRRKYEQAMKRREERKQEKQADRDHEIKQIGSSQDVDSNG